MCCCWPYSGGCRAASTHTGTHTERERELWANPISNLADSSTLKKMEHLCRPSRRRAPRTHRRKGAGGKGLHSVQINSLNLRCILHFDEAREREVKSLARTQNTHTRMTHFVHYRERERERKKRVGDAEDPLGSNRVLSSV